MPCSPPIRFCSIVGQASIHTARAIGPSTMERSRGLVGRGRAGAVMGEDSRSGPVLTPARHVETPQGARARRADRAWPRGAVAPQPGRLTPIELSPAAGATHATHGTET